MSAALYVGVKLVNAEPMTRQAYNDYRGWKLPDNEDGNDDGYLVEYLDGGKANMPDRNGYVSWSPKDVFERAYKNGENLSFGLALDALKQGLRVQRTGWNGKGMHLEMCRIWNGVFAHTGPLLPWIGMKTADNCFVPWLASQTDMLADDWRIVQ